MNRNYFLLMTIIGLALITIVSAFYSSNRKFSRTVTAQSIYAEGCWEFIDPTSDSCACMGATGTDNVDTLIIPGFGVGNNGFIEGTATCQPDGINECTVSVHVSQNNEHNCSTPTPIPTPEHPEWCNISGLAEQCYVT